MKQKIVEYSGQTIAKNFKVFKLKQVINERIWIRKILAPDDGGVCFWVKKKKDFCLWRPKRIVFKANILKKPIQVKQASLKGSPLED